MGEALIVGPLAENMSKPDLLQQARQGTAWARDLTDSLIKAACVTHTISIWARRRAGRDQVCLTRTELDDFALESYLRRGAISSGAFKKNRGRLMCHRKTTYVAEDENRPGDLSKMRFLSRFFRERRAKVGNSPSCNAGAAALVPWRRMKLRARA